MEINITHLLETDMFEFSHSRAEGGQDAGRNTWDAALNGPRPLLNTPDEFEAFRDFARSTGGWTREEIEAWDENECQALFLQFVAGDIRKCPAILDGITLSAREEEGKQVWYYEHENEPDFGVGPFDFRSDAYAQAAGEQCGCNQAPRADSLDQIDWQQYEHDATSGHIPSCLFRTDSGEVFYSLSN